MIHQLIFRKMRSLRTLKMDVYNMVDGTGKVFFCDKRSITGFESRCIAESFTDYLVQYAATILEYGTHPLWGEVGGNDFMSQLPRDQSHREFVLMPQPLGWDVGNYFPAYCTAAVAVITCTQELMLMPTAIMPYEW